MFHLTWARIGTVAAVFVLLGSLGFVALSHGPSVSARGPGEVATHVNVLPAAHPRPLVVPWTSSIVITSTYSGGQQLPITVAYTINVTNAPLNAANDSVSLSIWNGANLIANVSEPVATNTTAYTTTVGYGVLTSLNFNGGTLPTTPYHLIGWLTANNTTAYNATLNAPLATTVQSAPVTVTLLITNLAGSITPPAAFEPSGFLLNYTYAITGSTGVVSDSNNMTLSLQVKYVPNGLALNHSVVQAASTPGTGTPVPTSGQISLDTSLMPFSGNYLFTLWITAQDAFTGAQARTIGPAGHVTIAVGTPATSILYPLNGSSYVAGSNITISVDYTGDYASTAQVTVFNSASAVVFTQGVFRPGLGAHATAVVWLATLTGKFLIELNVTSPYQGAVASWANVTIAAAALPPGSQTIWMNATNYQNTTVTNAKLLGLTPGAAAAVLLVVGLIIGLIVALALGRMMWGGSTPSSAQPWKSQTGGKPNECSVCHQSFATADELKEHSKDAHGMS
ncbi:MAG: hypothetical protein L3K13_00010 [Thermoplasmata archaeon]|nr:hypothetical protein [Thermoplasmata archaeon]